jgi:hypothetical protein
MINDEVISIIADEFRETITQNYGILRCRMHNWGDSASTMYLWVMYYNQMVATITISMAYIATQCKIKCEPRSWNWAEPSKYEFDMADPAWDPKHAVDVAVSWIMPQIRNFIKSDYVHDNGLREKP